MDIAKHVFYVIGIKLLLGTVQPYVDVAIALCKLLNGKWYGVLRSYVFLNN